MVFEHGELSGEPLSQEDAGNATFLALLLCHSIQARYFRTLTVRTSEVTLSKDSPLRKVFLRLSSHKNEIPGTAVLVEPAQPQEGVRRWQRFTVDIRLKASFRRNDTPLAVFGRGSDVSQGGMAAYIPSELPVGSSIDLELSLPYVSGEQPIRMVATVRNRNGFRYGLEYLTLSQIDKDRLLKSLRALSLTQ
jgi:hypothetical protein